MYSRRAELLARVNWSQGLFVAGACVLAIAPIRWLIHTWSDPAFDSPGPGVFALVATLFLWSWSSEAIDATTGGAGRAVPLLAVTALIRLASQVLDVDVLGGVTLVVDVYALALLARLDKRGRSLSPFWLAVLFGCSLPLERILQRVVGYALQRLSAEVACDLLGWMFGAVECAGVDIRLEGRHLLVDVPCSGARGLVTLTLLFAVLATIRHPGPIRALCGVATTLVASTAANIVRITALAVGMARPDWLGGIDVMDQPWHESVGLVALAVGSLPVITWARRVPQRRPCPYLRRREVTLAVDTAAARCAPTPAAPRLGVAAGMGFVLFATITVLLPGRPLDASRPVAAPPLPAFLAGHPRVDVALNDKEHLYFTRYGGAAAKARYGPHAVLAVATTAPLRHLHAPDECMRGSGHEVRLLGTTWEERIPSAVYRSRTPDGALYRVAATYLSNRGHVATSVAEAVWHWAQAPETVWTGIQRIGSWDLTEEEHAAFDRALAAALEIPERDQRFTTTKGDTS